MFNPQKAFPSILRPGVALPNPAFRWICISEIHLQALTVHRLEVCLTWRSFFLSYKMLLSLSGLCSTLEGPSGDTVFWSFSTDAFCEPGLFGTPLPPLLVCACVQMFMARYWGARCLSNCSAFPLVLQLTDIFTFFIIQSSVCLGFAIYLAGES